MLKLSFIFNKMTTVYFKSKTELIELLSIEEQDYLFYLIHERRIEKRCSEITDNARAMLTDLQQRKAKIGAVDELIADLLQQISKNCLESLFHTLF